MGFFKRGRGRPPLSAARKVIDNRVAEGANKPPLPTDEPQFAVNIKQRFAEPEPVSEERLPPEEDSNITDTDEPPARRQPQPTDEPTTVVRRPMPLTQTQRDDDEAAKEELSQPPQPNVDVVIILDAILNDIGLLIDSGTVEGRDLTKRLQSTIESQQRTDLFRTTTKACRMIMQYHKTLKSLQAELTRVRNECASQNDITVGNLPTLNKELEEAFGEG